MMSILAMRTWLRAPRWLRTAPCRRGQDGQAAVGFLVLMALILVLAASTMNIGEVSKLKTGTANAADAGALAFASWVASGENETALIAEGMWMNWMLTQLIFLLPFCTSFCYMIALYYAALWWVNYEALYASAAEPLLEAAWENAATAAVFSAIQNAQIDDPSGEAQEQVKALSERAKNGGLPPGTYRISWTRKGADGTPEDSWVEVEVQAGSAPELEMDGWSPFAMCIVPCIGYCCWSMPAWGGGQQEDQGDANDLLVGSGGVQNFTTLFGFIKIPDISMCSACFIIPITLGPFAQITPSEISDAEGQVTVTVRQHRQGGTNLGFWTMQYPEVVTSSATARYTESSVDMWPEGESESMLVGVL